MRFSLIVSNREVIYGSRILITRNIPDTIEAINKFGMLDFLIIDLDDVITKDKTLEFLDFVDEFSKRGDHKFPDNLVWSVSGEGREEALERINEIIGEEHVD